MDRMLDAATRILETRNFEELSVAEIVANADTSVGAFYGRFPDKDSLLDALDARFLAGFKEAVLQRLNSKEWMTGSLEYIITEAVSLLVQLYDTDKGLLRSLTIKARIHSDQRFRARETETWQLLYPPLQDLLVSRLRIAGHPDPVNAASFGFRQMFFAMRELLLWEPLRTGEPCNPFQLGTELSRAFLAYLSIGMK